METLGGRYQLAAEVSNGAIGTVRRGTDVRTGRPVAVKLLRPGAADQPDRVAAFATEADILAEVSHPAIVAFIDFITGDDQHAIVMEFADGHDLRRRIRRDGPLRPAVAVGVLEKVAEAVAYLHERGIVHGDIKPGNVLVAGSDDEVRLADFGVARRLADDARNRAVQATPEYVAPEVVAGCYPTPAVDVYALGITLFELLTARSPFRGGPPSQVLGRHGRCVPVPPPGLPPVLWPIIEDCLAGHPAARPTAGELAAWLREVAPAVADLPALAASPPEQITWWPRSAGATMAVARVSWVPLSSVPVSPASASAGRMVAIPVAEVPGPVAEVPGPVLPSLDPTSPALPTAVPAPDAGVRRTPAALFRAVWASIWERPGRHLAVGLLAAGFAVSVALGFVVLVGLDSAESVRDPGSAPGTAVAGEGPVAGTDPSPHSSHDAGGTGEADGKTEGTVDPGHSVDPGRSVGPGRSVDSGGEEPAPGPDVEGSRPGEPVGGPPNIGDPMPAAPLW